MKEIECKLGSQLIGTCRFNNDRKAKPLVVISHGFKGFKEWGFIPYLAEDLATSGAIALSFDFSQNGILDPVTRTYDKEKFATLTVIQQIEDLMEVLDTVLDHKLNIAEFYENFSGEIVLLGHSLGGAISILVANQNKHISKLILWNSISKFDRYTERQKALWHQLSYIEFEDANTKQMLRINEDFLLDIEQNSENYSLIRAISGIEVPILILHAEQDLTVKIEEAERLFAVTNKKFAKLLVVEKANHTFGIVHPFLKSNDSLESAIDKTKEFMELDE